MPGSRFINRIIPAEGHEQHNLDCLTLHARSSLRRSGSMPELRLRRSPCSAPWLTKHIVLDWKVSAPMAAISQQEQRAFLKNSTSQYSTQRMEQCLSQKPRRVDIKQQARDVPPKHTYSAGNG